MDKKPKILIVEDESIIALTIESTLQSIGYDVFGIADSGEQCLTQLDSVTELPDLILLDIKLKTNISGIEIAKIVKQKYNVPVIFLTAFSTLELLNEAKKVNPYGYIIKPFTTRDLENGIQLALYKHESEIKLIESENKYRRLVENINEGILQINVDGDTISFVNLPFCEMFELSEADLIGKNAFEVLYFFNDNQDTFYNLRQERLKGNKERFEIKLLVKSGIYKHFIINANPIKNEEGKIIGSLSIWHDISEIKKNKSQLNKFYNAIEQSDELILITNKAGVIEYANSTYYKTTGYNPQELIGQTPKILMSGVHTKPFYEKMWGTILTGKSFTGEFINRKKNGDLFYEEKIITPLIDETGDLTHFISTGRNITERILTEKKIHAYEKLQAFNEKKQAKIRAFSLIRGQEAERKRISRELHDGLGQTLTAAKLNLENLNIKEMLNTPQYADLIKVYNLIDETIKEVRKISYDLSPSNLHDFGLLSAIKAIVSLINKEENKLKVIVEGNLASERFNKDVEINIFRIIQEGLNNAIKHAEADIIEIKVNLINSLLEVSIYDNGKGFAVSKNIFHIENNTLSNGLRNIKERSNVIGGNLDIISEIGKGTTILFKIKVKS